MTLLEQHGLDNITSREFLQPQPQFCDAVAVFYTSDTEAVLSSTSYEFSNLKAGFFRKHSELFITLLLIYSYC